MNKISIHLDNFSLILKAPPESLFTMINDFMEDEADIIAKYQQEQVIT